MATTNTTTRFDAHQATAEVHKNNYDLQRSKGASHQEAFNKATDASKRFWAWLISLGIIAAIGVLVFMVNWSSKVGA